MSGYRRGLGLALGLALAVSVGCNCNPSGRNNRGPGAAGDPSAAPTNRLGPNAKVGTVVGRVLLAEGASLPRWTLEDIGRGPNSSPIPEECGPPRQTDTEPVSGVGTPTRLVGVMVSATGNRETFFRALGEWQPAERHVRIERCRLQPKMISATEGDTLIITNESELAFLPSVGPTPFHETLIRGQSRRVHLDHGGVSSVRCGFAASCGRSDVVVILHPVHTVTNADGRFEMRNVPADQDVVIHAWHPRFEEANVTTRVARNGRVEVDLVLRPRAARPAAPERPFFGPYRAGPESDFPEGVPTPPTPDAGRR